MFLIGYIKCVPDWVPSLDLLSAEPMPYKARLGARFVYPIGYYKYVPDRVLNSLYPPSFQGLLEFCSQEVTTSLGLPTCQAPINISVLEDKFNGGSKIIKNQIRIIAVLKSARKRTPNHTPHAKFVEVWADILKVNDN